MADANRLQRVFAHYAVHKAFYSNVQQLGLDISTIAPIHGPAVPWSDFLKVVVKTD